MTGGVVPTSAGRKKGKEADGEAEKMLSLKEEVKDVPNDDEEDGEESEEEGEEKEGEELEGEEATKKTKKTKKAKKAKKEAAATKTEAGAIKTDAATTKNKAAAPEKEAAPVVTSAEAAKLADEDLQRRIAEQEKEHLKLRLKAQRNQGLAMLFIAVIGFFYAQSKENGDLPPLDKLLERLGPGLLATFGTIVALTLISKYVFGTVG
mmetsp:Transcript_35174/g.67651  ORF Transcript_35174/g.67651 Transcript_35174/m.67651 type:complete len:207 (-) Transcript_35174:470-1090(-)